MNITIELLEEWGSCYSHAEHVRLFGGREYFTPLEIADMDNIPAKDRVWVLLHEGILTSSELRIFACDFAEYALSKIDNPDPAIINLIKVTKFYAVGKATKNKLAVAEPAAWPAAGSAAWAAAWYAANAAAGTVASYDYVLRIIKAKLEGLNEH